ncbi:MAG TPA: DegT/DnrJ/EryC1/StrS family aminotransferase, partial [Candidatus Binatia bacterium]|nr:DegT/DnrJ/EryC1/StrS family aminotransferase [Candidatus Binatia bacterium]
IQAAIGIHQLAKLDGFIARRTRLARRYRESFQDVEGVRLLGSVPYAYKHAWHLLVVEVDAGSLDIGRDEFLDILKQRNIGAGVHFPALHMQPYYQKAFRYRAGDFPNAERAAARILSLPLFPAMTESDVDDVAATVGAIVADHRRA